MIELLTVIAILGVLAGLLLPTLGKAKAKGHQVVCMSNMRHLGVAISMYAGDYRGVLPHSDDHSPVDETKLDKAGCWFYAVDPYLLNRAVSSSVDLQQKTAPFKQDPIWKTFDAALRSDWHTIKMNRKLIGRKGDWNYSQDHTAEAVPTARRSPSKKW